MGGGPSPPPPPLLTFPLDPPLFTFAEGRFFKCSYSLIFVQEREQVKKKQKKQDNIHEVKPPQLFPFNFHFQQPYHNLNRTPKAWLAFTFLPAVFRRIYFYSGEMLNFNHLMIWKTHQKTIFLRFLPKILFWWYFHRLYSFSSSTNFRVGGFSFSPTDLYISYSDFYSQHPWCLTSSFKNSILKIQNLSRLYFYSTFLGKPKLVEIKRL